MKCPKCGEVFHLKSPYWELYKQEKTVHHFDTKKEAMAFQATLYRNDIFSSRKKCKNGYEVTVK